MNTLNVKMWGNTREECWAKLCKIYFDFRYISETPMMRKDETICGFVFEIEMNH